MLHTPGVATQSCLGRCVFSEVRGRSVSSRQKWIFLQLMLTLAAVLLTPIVRAQTKTLVVIVNPTIGVQHLTRSEVLDIFLGRYRNFPTGASALPIDLDVSSDARNRFYLLLAHKNPSDMVSYWARLSFSGKISPPFAVSGVETAIDIVATNPNAIAYVDRSVVDNRVHIAFEIGE
jgi:ABC-type phosphate transport system substrate-binding protein